jgi:copper chaperone CopZ
MNSSTRIALIFVAALMLPSGAFAELLRVQLTVHGMDCATCAHGVRIAMQKVDGVESIEVSLERALADIRLRPGNRVGLQPFRQIVRSNGFAPKDALVTVTGTLVNQGGKPALNVTGLDAIWPLVSDPRHPAAHADAVTRLASNRSGRVQVTGVVAPPASNTPPEQIMVREVK